MQPDKDGRIDGTTYRGDRAPEDSTPLRWRQLSTREVIARVLARAVVRVVRPHEGDVLVVSGGPDAGSAIRRELVYAARRAGCVSAVFVPAGAMVHAEPRRLESEDRGYRETKSYGADAGPQAKNLDRGVHVGTPEDVPEAGNG